MFCVKKYNKKKETLERHDTSVPQTMGPSDISHFYYHTHKKKKKKKRKNSVDIGGQPNSATFWGTFSGDYCFCDTFCFFVLMSPLFFFFFFEISTPAFWEKSRGNASCKRSSYQLHSICVSPKQLFGPGNISPLSHPQKFVNQKPQRLEKKLSIHLWQSQPNTNNEPHIHSILFFLSTTLPKKGGFPPVFPSCYAIHIKTKSHQHFKTLTRSPFSPPLPQRCCRHCTYADDDDLFFFVDAKTETRVTLHQTL